MDKSKVGGQFSGSLRLCHSENKLPKNLFAFFDVLRNATKSEVKITRHVAWPARLVLWHWRRSDPCSAAN